MIKVIKESDDHFPGDSGERCCICRSMTRYWYTKKDVACCPICAKTAKPKDIPSKDDWMRRERDYDTPIKVVFTWADICVVVTAWTLSEAVHYLEEKKKYGNGFAANLHISIVDEELCTFPCPKDGK